MSNNKLKTIIFLGAGFSAPAKFPIQKGIISEMLSPPNKNILSEEPALETEKFYKAFITVGIFLLENYTSINSEKYKKEYRKIEHNLSLRKIGENFFRKAQKNKKISHILSSDKYLENYISKYFKLTDEDETMQLSDLKEKIRCDLENKKIDVDLEELFTKFDKCVKNQTNWNQYSYRELDVINHSILQLFVFYFGRKDMSFSLNEDYKSFGEFVEQENVAIITTNWDTICEQILKDQKINYFCPNEITDIKKTTRKKCVNIIKVHGSINWFTCLNCGKLQIKPLKEEANFLLQDNKRFCKNCKSEESDDYLYVPEIITPTMIKSFDRRIYSNIWQSAENLLKNASRIIFVGYSLPPADFELKYMLTKYIPKNIDIDVVLYNDCIKKDNLIEVPEDRYRRSFPKNKLSFSYAGFTKYFNELNQKNKEQAQ